MNKLFDIGNKSIVQLHNLLFEALRESYIETQLLKLSFDRNVSKITEYFITVNICKKLFDWNKSEGYIYTIEAEKSTFDFFRNCFDTYTLKEPNNIFSKAVFSSDSEKFKDIHSIIRKGKIDIALSSNNSNYYNSSSKLIIEVKSVNPNFIKLCEDFERIQTYLDASIPNFDNSLENGYIAFIKHINQHRKIHNKGDLLKLKDRYISKLKNKLSALKLYSSINYEIFDKNIDMSSFEDLLVENGDDFSEVAYNTFIAFSVVIKIKRI
jgi:hypothetical protein